MSKILLIDGSNYLFRAFHGLPELSTSRGEPTGAMKGFLGMLGRVVGMVKPDYAAIVFDAPGKNFRHEMYPEYKANRPPMPDDLRVQIAPLHGVLEALGWPLLIIPGVEADDVIASLAEVAKRDGHDVVIATGDKDMAQLVEDRVILLNTMNTTFYDREGVIEKYGVPPEHIIDYLALMGDKVDNVPGIEKCGPKTAAKWVNEIGGIDAIKAHAHEVTGKIGENLRKGLGFLDEAVKLVTIKRDCVVPGAKKTEDLAFRAPDDAALSAFAHRWEMSRAGLDRAMAAPAKRLLKAAPPAQPVQTSPPRPPHPSFRPSRLLRLPQPTRPPAWCRPRSARPKRSCARSRTMRRTPAKTPTRSSLKSSTRRSHSKRSARSSPTRRAFMKPPSRSRSSGRARPAPR